MSVAENRPKKLTVREAAAYAGVSPSTVYAWCEQRMLTHYRAPAMRRARGKILIDPRDIDALLEKLKVEAR